MTLEETALAELRQARKTLEALLGRCVIGTVTSVLLHNDLMTIQAAINNLESIQPKPAERKEP